MYNDYTAMQNQMKKELNSGEEAEERIKAQQADSKSKYNGTDHH